MQKRQRKYMQNTAAFRRKEERKRERERERVVDRVKKNTSISGYSVEENVQ